jgi:hypothetical protein
MKKNLILTICLLFVYLVSFAGKFVFIPVTETQNLETLFQNNDLKIHYYCDNYVLASTDAVNIEGTVVLDENAFGDVNAYAIVYCLEDDKAVYLQAESENALALYSGEHFFIMKLLSEDFKPAKNDGMIAITNTEARLPKSTISYPIITEPDENVQNLISQVNTESVMGYIQSLEDFVTRRYDHANGVLAQNWIKDQYEAMGLEVELQTLPYPTNSSKNVIAVQMGTEFPNEYIVLGGHFDSYTYESINNAPGADDDASGSSGILEVARILSQHEFKRTIIYCAFSAEEIGLYGSSAYATRCQQQGMNILGYFNLDMTGYLTPGDPIHFCLIYPNGALTLADYFVNISEIYFPTIPVSRHANLPWGDSDHTSFNNKGYKGIWWFEDINCDSPFIHHTQGNNGCGNNCTGTIPCTGDIIGPTASVNNPEQVTVFTQAMVACIATLAELDGEAPPPLAPPTNCKAEFIENMSIQITWDAPTTNTPDTYYIYRDGEYFTESETTSYTDEVEDFEEYCYTVTAIYSGTESVQSNKSCASVPPPPPPPAPTNCTATWVEEEANINNNILVTWDAPAESAPDAYFVYRDETKITQTTDTQFVDALETTGEYCYKIKAIYEEEQSDFSNQSCAEIPTIDGIKELNSKYVIYPNPATNELRVTSYKLQVENIEIFDVSGRIQKGTKARKESTKEVVIDISGLAPGIYFVKIANEMVGKFVKE